MSNLPMLIPNQINDINWAINATYPFYCTQILRPDLRDPNFNMYSRCKHVFKGYFVDSAPDGLQKGVYYYLKFIHAISNSNTDFYQAPQLRERNELLPLKGTYFRKLDAINPDGLDVQSSLLEYFDCDDNWYCIAVERPYHEIPDNNSIETMTAYERLSYLEQVCLALFDLYKDEYSVAGHRIIAHRDLKLSNCLVEREHRHFLVKLTDFASVKFADDAFDPTETFKSSVDPEQGSGNDALGQTSPYLMSAENTAPESLSYHQPVTSKVDVYALGTMLASLFGYVEGGSTRNPCVQFCFTNQWKNSHDKGDQTPLAQAFAEWTVTDSTLDWEQEKASWMELALNHTFHWGDHPESSNNPDPNILWHIRQLFFRATRANPDNRCTLAEFLSEIRVIQKLCGDKLLSYSPLLYNVPESVFLFHQHDLHTTRSHLIKAVEAVKQASSGPVSIRAAWYYNPDDSMAANVKRGAGGHLSSFSSLQDAIRSCPITSPANADSIGYALDSIFRYYHRNQYDVSFSGDIHIFTCQELTSEHLSGILFRDRLVPLQNILSLFYNHSILKGDFVNIYLHSPREPQLPSDLSGFFTWVRMSSPYKAAPENKPGTENAEEVQVSEAPDMPLDELYLSGSEALFFLHGEDNVKVYVSRRKI